MTEQSSQPADAMPGDESAVSVLTDFGDAGWTANHLVRDAGMIECGECGVTTSAADVVVGAQHRIEGASDPDDMQLVVGTGCPECSTRGAIVLGYGPNASEEDTAVYALIDLQDVPDPVAQ